MNKRATILSLVKGPTGVINLTIKYYSYGESKEIGQLDNHTNTWREVDNGEQCLLEGGCPVTNITIFSLEMTAYLIFPRETLFFINLSMEGLFMKHRFS